MLVSPSFGALLGRALSPMQPAYVKEVRTKANAEAETQGMSEYSPDQ